MKMTSDQAKKADLRQLYSQPQKVVANMARAIAVNFVGIDDRDVHSNHCGSMDITDGELTVTNSIAYRSNYHLEFSLPEPLRSSARSEILLL